MLTIQGLEKKYGSRRVLCGVDLSVAAGQAVALVGGNGSGKTTTLRCIVGLARPDAGSLRVGGVDVIARPREALERVSYLPQRPAFPGTLTVREVLAVTARLRRQPDRAVECEIEQCGLGCVAGSLVSALSGGERQRVGLAVTFLADVPLFVFDEPSASLDPTATALLLDRARDLRREGRAVLYSTHVASDIDRLATHVALLNKGRVEMIHDPRLGGEGTPARRATTPGEEALRRLEEDDEETLDCVGGRGAYRGGMLDRTARAALAAAGPR